MRKQVLIYLAIFAVIYFSAVIVALLIKPIWLSNLLGFWAMLSYMGSLIPGLFRVILPNSKKHPFIIFLLRHRRFLGVAAFMLALNHGVLQLLHRQINLLDLETYLNYFQGLSMFVVMTLLALTSSDESVKYLKRNWKKLHQLSYLIILLLPWHIIDKMQGHWTFLTPVSILLSIILVVFFLIRKAKETLKNSG